MTKDIITLSDLIKNIDFYSDDYDLYMLKNFKFRDIETCILINNEEELIHNNLKLQYIFGIYTLKDIIENLKQQKLNYNIDDVLKSMQFYYKNDSFIELK